MKKKITIATTSIILSISINANSAGLLGKDYVAAEVGIVKFGDSLVDELIGKGYGAAFIANFNIEKNIDLNISLAHVWASNSEELFKADLDSTAIGGDLIYFLDGNEGFKPYFYGGVGLVKSSFEYTDSNFKLDDSHSDLLINLGAGIEIEVSSQGVIDFGVSYNHIDSDGIFLLSAGSGFWINENALLGGNVSIDTDDGDKIFSLGAAFTY